MPRRPRGTGSISERKDGRWQGRYYVNGKACYVYAETKAACNRLLLQAIKENKQKTKGKPRSVLLKDLALAWLESRVDYRANSEDQRRNCIENHIIPALGDKAVADIDRETVIEWVAQLARDYAPATVRSNYIALGSVLGEAVTRDLIESSPCYKIKLPTIPRTEHTVLDLGQAKRFTKQLKGHWLEPIVKLALATAMRESELLALKWSDVDLTRGVIIVRHNVAYVSKRKHVPGPPKTKASERVIDLADFALDVLKAHKVAQLATRDVWAEKDLVFPNARGSYRIRQNVTVSFKGMVAKAKVPAITFHELRHSAVSILLAMGINIKVIQEICGHSDIMTTLRLYGHLMPSAQRNAMKQYNEAWEQAALDMDVRMDGEAKEQGA